MFAGALMHSEGRNDRKPICTKQSMWLWKITSVATKDMICMIKKKPTVNLGKKVITASCRMDLYLEMRVKLTGCKKIPPNY